MVGQVTPVTTSLPTPQRKFPVLSLLLLLVAYISFGWFISSPEFPEVQVRGFWISVPMVLAFVWVWILCFAFLNPISSFSRFITRWFKSDTVAFLSIFMFAGTAALVLYWMHIFLYILTIIAAEALARVDFQTAGFSNWQAFFGLLVVSLIGLVIGWALREYWPLFMREILPMIAPQIGEVLGENSLGR